MDFNRRSYENEALPTEEDELIPYISIRDFMEQYCIKKAQSDDEKRAIMENEHIMMEMEKLAYQLDNYQED